MPNMTDAEVSEYLCDNETYENIPAVVCTSNVPFLRKHVRKEALLSIFISQAILNK